MNANTFNDLTGACGMLTLPHGGNRAAFKRQFPNAPEPFLDLSTGINPFGYPLPAFPQTALTLLPQEKDLEMLKSVACQYFNAASPEYILPVAGTQSIIGHLLVLSTRRTLRVLGKTYSGYARAAALAGIMCETVFELNALAKAGIAVIVNPNNPDGRWHSKADILALAKQMAERKGLLIVDEAFMDIAERDESVIPFADNLPLIVLRSFGKFFGLPGVRLGFVVAHPALLYRLAAVLGPWAVSGPALFAGITAFEDTHWIDGTKRQLIDSGARLQKALVDTGLEPIGGTALFSLVQTQQADHLFDHLGGRGIMIRRFAESPHWLRFGLPELEAAWERLHAALLSFKHRTMR
jgi:cobalamin biosynthetic protein CobC